MTENKQNIHQEMRVLMEFIYTNRDKLSEIYEIEHNTTGIENPENQGNPGVLVVTRKTDNQVDIFYYQWSAMEPELQSSVLVACQNSTNQFHLILIDNVINKSVMIGMEKTNDLPGLDPVIEE
jgi:predicted neutral ceramidase superfamily lipid hydrolase